jgi:hypothetical protein
MEEENLRQGQAARGQIACCLLLQVQTAFVTAVLSLFFLFSLALALYFLFVFLHYWLSAASGAVVSWIAGATAGGSTDHLVWC